jgi:hypothetical protein
MESLEQVPVAKVRRLFAEFALAFSSPGRTFRAKAAGTSRHVVGQTRRLFLIGDTLGLERKDDSR